MHNKKQTIEFCGKIHALSMNLVMCDPENLADPKILSALETTNQYLSDVIKRGKIFNEDKS